MNIIISVYNYIENLKNDKNNFDLKNNLNLEDINDSNKINNIIDILKRRNEIINKFHECLNAFKM